MDDYNKKRLLKLCAFGVLCVALAALWTFFVWRDEIAVMLAELGEFFRDGVKFLDGVPLICYSLVIFALPIFFLPVTPVFILAAARADESSYAVVLFFCLLGITANVIVSYFISRKFGAALRGVLAKRGVRIPKVPLYEQYELVFLMRMIPGNPLAVQNYVLGAADVSFFKYAVVSLPIQYMQVAVYVYFGEGIFDGGISKIILGSSMLMVIAVVARMLEKRYGHKLKKSDGISEAK